MIDALIQGRIHRAPQSRTSQNGKRFATANVRTATRDGSAIFVSVIAFSQTACDALLALQDGDAVAIAGELTPKVYTPQNGEPRPSLDLLAHAVLTEYHVARKRKAVQTPAHEGAAPELDDALAF
jgi:single-stranded DNA-binding protein